MLAASFDELLEVFVGECQRHFGERFISVAVIGPVDRGIPRPDSDIDFVIGTASLPRGHVAQVADFAAVGAQLAASLRDLRPLGIAIELSAVLKTPSQAKQGSPLFLDMLDDARLLVDRGGILAHVFEQFRERWA